MVCAWTMLLYVMSVKDMFVLAHLFGCGHVVIMTWFCRRRISVCPAVRCS